MTSRLPAGVFRFNRRTGRSRGSLFLRLVQQGLATSPVERTASAADTSGRATCYSKCIISSIRE
jgi:hypothetical protein